MAHSSVAFHDVGETASLEALMPVTLTASTRNASQRRQHADVAGQEFFVDVIMDFLHRGIGRDGFPVCGAGAVALDLSIVTVAGHGQSLDPFMGHIHFHVVNDGRKILVLPGIGNADPECGIAIFIGDGIFLHIVGAAVETDALFLIDLEPQGLHEPGKRVGHVVGIEVHAEGMGYEAAPVLGIIAVLEFVGFFPGGIKGLHFCYPVSPLVLVKFNGRNGGTVFPKGFDVQGRTEAAVHVGIGIDLGGGGILEGNPILRHGLGSAHEQAGSQEWDQQFLHKNPPLETNGFSDSLFYFRLLMTRRSWGVRKGV